MTTERIRNNDVPHWHSGDKPDTRPPHEDHEHANLYAEAKHLSNECYQELLCLRYFCGYTWEEIAEKMHYSTRHIYRIHNRVLAELKHLKVS